MTRIEKQRLSILLIAALLVLIIGGGVLSYRSLNSLSEHAVERLASKQLGVKVSVDTLHIDPESESVLIEGVTINNPKGFRKGEAITIKSVDIDARHLNRDLLAFEDINVTGMNMRVEVSDGKTNLSALRDQVTNLATKKKPIKLKLVRVIVDHIVLSGTHIEPAMITDAIARGLSPVALPEIHMRGIGEIDPGISTHQAVSHILTRVINTALRSAADSGYLVSLTPEQQKAINAQLDPAERVAEDDMISIPTTSAQKPPVKAVQTHKLND